MSSPAKYSGEEPLIKKTRRNKKKNPSPVLPRTTQQSTPIPSLPDDLLLSSFARVSRLLYPALSLVSKRFRSLLASPELYLTRSLLGRAESCLYLCLYLSPDPNPRWFTLCQKPNRKKEKNLSGNFLVPIAKSPHAHCRGVVAVGSSIYVIGGFHGSPSSIVWVLDCRCHVWRKAPRMRVDRAIPEENVVDGKIYEAGGCRDFNSSNWMEVFDPKTQTWEFVLCPHAERCSTGGVFKSSVIEGRIFHVFAREGLVYKREEDRGEAIEGFTNMNSGWQWISCCVIDNVLCCYRDSKMKLYNTKRQVWMNMKGLIGLRA